MSALNENLLPEVLSGLDAMTAIRRDLHAHPELGMCEVRTAKIAADAGIPMRIVSGLDPLILYDIMAGKEPGTLFLPPL